MMSGLGGPCGCGRRDVSFVDLGRDGRRQNSDGGVTLDIGVVRLGSARAIAASVLHPLGCDLVDEAVLEVERRCPRSCRQAVRAGRGNMEGDPIARFRLVPVDTVPDFPCGPPSADTHRVVRHLQLQSLAQQVEFLAGPFYLRFQFCQPVPCHTASPGPAGLRVQLGLGIVGKAAQLCLKLILCVGPDGVSGRKVSAYPLLELASGQRLRLGTAKWACPLSGSARSTFARAHLPPRPGSPDGPAPFPLMPSDKTQSGGTTWE